MAGIENRKPQVKVIKCKNCAGSVELRAQGHSVSLICRFCGVTIDVNDENYNLLRAYKSNKRKINPTIPIGSFGEFKGKRFEVIGFMRRSTQSIYTWKEYLLFNPYYGFRWLVEDEGHWSFVKPVREIPSSHSFGREKVGYFNNNYFLYSKHKATVDFVAGEFYWRVRQGETTQVEDYVRPPEMLSKEGTKHEVVWSLAQYLEPEQVKQAFNLPDLKLPKPKNIAPHQPYQYKHAFRRQSLVACFAMLLIFFLQCSTAFRGSPETVYERQLVWEPTAGAETQMTESFSLGEGKGTATVILKSKVHNRWIHVDSALINIETGERHLFNIGSSFYNFGGEVEDDRSNKVVLTKIPSGTYKIAYSISSSMKMRTEYSLKVVRNEALVVDFFLALGLISVGWGALAYRRRMFHVKRWNNSDYSPYEEDE